jgi:hypothetical protein
MRTFSPGGARTELQVASVTYPARLCSSVFVTSATWLVLSQPQERRVVWRAGNIIVSVVGDLGLAWRHPFVITYIIPARTFLRRYTDSARSVPCLALFSLSGRYAACCYRPRGLPVPAEREGWDQSRFIHICVPKEGTGLSTVQ